MNILCINGSPRIGGNTDILLDNILEGTAQKDVCLEKIILNTLKISPCQECENTRDDGICLINDDMQALYKKIEIADVIIIGCPIFFGSLTAQTKIMIDRFQCIWKAKYLFKKEIFDKQKIGYFVSVEASTRKDSFDNAKAIVKNLFATINTRYKGDILCSDINEKADILKHPSALKEALKLGQDITSLNYI